MHFRKEFLPYFLIIGFVFTILATVFYFSFFGRKIPTPPVKPSASPVSIFSPRPQEIDTENLQYHPDASTIVQTIDDSSQKMLDKDVAIGHILTKLPYKGNFFTLEYSYQTNAFTITLSADNQTQANQEFDQFLKSNKIENRNWLYNLKTVSL